ncbi:MAG TPA: YDG domain-containing protein, partial [Alphaproteobacteria bacterium]|nr:YDG domain-containing protein [Alphaproteobacteria bacterium]
TTSSDLDVTLTSQGGTLTLSSATDIETGGGNLFLIGDQLSMDSNFLSGGGTGTLTVKPYTNGRTMGVGDGMNGDLSLATDYFDNNRFNAAFASVTLGSATTGQIYFGHQYTLKNNTTIEGNNGMVIADGADMNIQKNLTLQVDTGDIITENYGFTTFGARFNKTAGSNATITFNAAGNVALGGSGDNEVQVVSTHNALSTVINADSDNNGSGGVTLDQFTGTTHNGDFTVHGRSLTMSSAGGDGSLAANIDAGSGTMTLNVTGGGSVTETSGTSLRAASLLLQGSGVAYTLKNGTINVIGTLAANTGSVSLINVGALAVNTVGSTDGITTSGNVTLEVQGGSSGITLSKAITSTGGNIVLAMPGDFTNNLSSNTGLVASGGRYFVYSTDPAASLEAMTGYSKHYNQSYTDGATPSYASSGNWFFYTVAPTLTVDATAGSITYGAADPTITPGFSGFIDSDVAGTAGITGAANFTFASFTASGAGFRPVGTYAITTAGAGSLASSLGYAFSTGSAHPNLTVGQKNVSLSSITASNKVYDGTTDATLTARTLGGILSGDDAQVLNGTASFNNKNVGTRTVTGSSFSLSGSDAANYHFTTTTIDTSANITPATLTYTATPQSVMAGAPISGLTGTLVGFAAGDNQGNATAGSLVWATTATSASNPGSYPITGSGLTADNYVFAQAVANDTALTLQPQPAPSVQPTVSGTPESVPPPATPPAPVNENVVVTVKPAEPGAPPAVSAATGGAQSFSFTVPPAAVEQALGNVAATMTSTARLPNGGGLPSWLSYDSSSRTFSAANVPPG